MNNFFLNKILLEAPDIAPVGSSAKPLNLFGIPQWAIYLIATIFLVASLISFFSFLHVNKKTHAFRDKQLKQFRAKNRHLRNLSYREAGLILPPLRRAYWFLPIFLGLIFAILAIAFYTGSSLHA